MDDTCHTHDMSGADLGLLRSGERQHISGRSSQSGLSEGQPRDYEQRQTPSDNITHPHLPAFWDNLSKIHLTTAALQEIDRRNSANIIQPRWPLTRGLVRREKDSKAIVFADTYTRHCDASITNNLRRFARQGGPDMSEVRERPGPVSGLLRATCSEQTQDVKDVLSGEPSMPVSSARKTGPYDRNFQQHLIDHNVFPAGYRHPDGWIPQLPSNWVEINERLRRPRRSLSPLNFTDNDFHEFQAADFDACKEKQVTTSVIPIIEGSIGDAKCTSGGIPFRKLEYLTGDTTKANNPDIYYGARPEQLDRRVREELEGLIVPSTQTDLPICPNFFMAVKGPNGSPFVAMNQACYDGASGERGIHSLQNYGQAQPVFDNQASTITTVYFAGTLKMYTIYRTEATYPDSPPRYYMHRLGSWAMDGDIEMFRAGATAYRNARDWAEERRNEAIEHANRVVAAAAASPIHTTSRAHVGM